MAGFIKNFWARYWDRSYQQIKDSVLTRLGSKVPEITDHTENNPYVAEIDIFAGTHEQLGYYVDNAGRESHLDSCRLYRSGVSVARLMDYKIQGNIPYSADVVFRLNKTNTTGSDITIPAMQRVATASGIEYVTKIAIIPDGAIESPLTGATQYVRVTGVNIGVSTGTANMLVVFTEKIVHDSIILYVNSLAWGSRDTLAYELPTAEVFVQTVDKDGNVNIYTGNGTLYGKIPPSGEVMTADYRITLGAAGFADAGEINTMLTTPSLPPTYTVSVVNPYKSTGVSDVESLASMKEHIPMSVRTLNRAVTEDDYKAVASMCPGVALAGVKFACGKKVSIYIVPDGGGIASSVLVDSCQEYVDARKMITTIVKVTPAGEVKFKWTVHVKAANNYSNSVVQTNVENALLAFMSMANQTINGSVYLSDGFQAIEGAAGVVNSTIPIFTAQPYARPSDTTTHTLIWDRVVNNTSTSTIHWHIVFTDSTHFQLIRNGVLLSSGNTVGSPYTVMEIAFTVNAGTYSTSDDFEFVTYPYNPVAQFIQLDEPSLPASSLSDLTIIVTGGI